MRILIAYYSRSGHTEKLAQRLASEFEEQGHAVVIEKIASIANPSKWRLVPPLWSAIPLFPLYLLIPAFRRWWFKRYPQAEMAIEAPRHPDISGFDRVCIGGPKWLYIAYPLARYLKVVEGWKGKTVGAFATFCGPPLKVFELEMLFVPIENRLRARGARLGTRLAISSHHHEFFFFNEMEYLFRLVSRWRFGRSLRSFTLESDWGKAEVERFCREVTRPSAPAAESPID